MEILLNRWRGTGKVFPIPFLKGVHLYAAYIALVISLFSTWYYGIIAGLLFMLGESMGWGKWIGYLVSSTPTVDYNDREGTKFPWIHKSAELVCKQTQNYKRYCQVALSIRGFWYWMPLYSFLVLIGLVQWYYAIVGVLVLSLGFPIACYVGKVWGFSYESKYFTSRPGWENQELVYGLLQGLVFWGCILL